MWHGQKKHVAMWRRMDTPRGDEDVFTCVRGSVLEGYESNIERYKARLVAKGFTQCEGIDYNETFSPVLSKDSLRIMMTLLVYFDLELHQMDVKTIFKRRD